MRRGKWNDLRIDPSTMEILDEEAASFYSACMQECIKLVRIFRAKETIEYFSNLISAMILEYNKENPNCKVKIAFRMKSLKSIFDKIVDYFSRDEDENPRCEYGRNPQKPHKPSLLKEITDVLAMTVILESREKIYCSTDPEIQDLADQEKRSYEMHKIMQQFKMETIESEFTDSTRRGYQYNCSRQKYYIRAILLLRKTMSLVPCEATELLDEYNDVFKRIRKAVPKKFYNKVISEIDEADVLSFESEDNIKLFLEMLDKKISYSKLSPEEKEFLKSEFTEDDVQTVDFLKVYQEFVAKITDRLDLALLTKQIEALIGSSELLQAFGVKIKEGSLVKKRTKNGFVANFIILETPFGPVEIQLASEHEYEEGNRGYAAHNKMEKKKFKLLSIPKKGDKDNIRFFRKWARFISPAKFLATSSGMVADRVSIEAAGDRENLELTISQEQRDSKDYQKIADYCEELNEREEDLFPEEGSQGKVTCYMGRSIKRYSQEKSWVPFLKRKMAEISADIDKIDRYEYGE